MSTYRSAAQVANPQLLISDGPLARSSDFGHNP